MEAIQAVVAVFILIMAGYVMRRNAFPSADVWPQIEKLSFFILFPCLLIVSIARSPLSDGAIDVWFLIFAVVGAQLITGLLTIPLILFRLVNGPDYTSIVQGAIRFNTYAAFGVLAVIAGTDSEKLIAPVLPFMIITANVLSITALSLFGHHAVNSTVHPLQRIFRGLYKNPFVIASCIGLLINFSGLTIPAVIEIPMLRLGQSGVALSLLAVGAALKFRGHHPSVAGYVLLASLYNLVVWPGLYVLLAGSFGLEGLLFQAGLIATLVPTATTSYLLARQMGGNAELMAAIAAGQTLLSMLSMSVWLMIYV